MPTDHLEAPRELSRQVDPGKGDMAERNRMRLRVFGPPTRQKPRGLRLDRHLNSQSSGTWCRHPPRHSAREVKNKIPLEFELPPDVVRILELYLQKFRPLLATDGSSYLFPARQGGAKNFPGSGDAHHVLGNTPAMTDKHYNQAQSLEASRRHNATLAALRAP